MTTLLRGFIGGMHDLRAQRKAAAAADDAAAAACRKEQLRLRELTILLLRLLRANLHRLVLAHVHPRDAGFVTDGAAPTLAPLHAALQELMGGGGGCFDRELQLEAVRVVGDGLEVLYGSMQLRAELLSSLIARYDRGVAAGDDEEGQEHLSGAHAALLERCLRHFSSPSGVVSLLPPARGDAEASAAAAGSQTMAALLGALFNVLRRETARALSVAAADGAPPQAAAAPSQTTALLVHGSALLAAYQRHLLSLVAEGVAERAAAAAAAASAKSYTDAGVLARDGATAALDAQLVGAEWVAGSPAGALPALRVLQTYAEELFAQSTHTLDVATALAEAQVCWWREGEGGPLQCPRTHACRRRRPLAGHRRPLLRAPAARPARHRRRRGGAAVSGRPPPPGLCRGPSAAGGPADPRRDRPSGARRAAEAPPCVRGSGGHAARVAAGVCRARLRRGPPCDCGAPSRACLCCWSGGRNGACARDARPGRGALMLPLAPSAVPVSKTPSSSCLAAAGGRRSPPGLCRRRPRRPRGHALGARPRRAGPPAARRVAPHATASRPRRGVQRGARRSAAQRRRPRRAPGP